MENNTKIINRLLQYLEFKGDNFNKLALNIGVSNSYFSKMVKSNGSLGEDVIRKILLNYEDINVTWLLLGEGNMLKNEDTGDAAIYLSQAKDDADSFSKALSILVCSSYFKNKGVDFTFDSFLILSKSFKAISLVIEVLQQTLEVDIANEVVEVMKKNTTNLDEPTLIDSSLGNVIDKYIDKYERLKSLSIEGIEILSDTKILNEIIKKVSVT